MSITKAQLRTFDGEEPDSTDPAYLAWRDQKVQTALTAAQAHPERRLPQFEVWKKFGLEA